MSLKFTCAVWSPTTTSLFLEIFTYSYPPSITLALTQIVEEVEEEEVGWLKGRVDGKEGVFSSYYVEMLPVEEDGKSSDDSQSSHGVVCVWVDENVYLVPRPPPPSFCCLQHKKWGEDLEGFLMQYMPQLTSCRLDNRMLTLCCWEFMWCSYLDRSKTKM